MLLWNCLQLTVCLDGKAKLFYHSVLGCRSQGAEEGTVTCLDWAPLGYSAANSSKLLVSLVNEFHSVELKIQVKERENSHAGMCRCTYQLSWIMKTVLNALKTGKLTYKTMKAMSGHQKRKKKQPTNTITCLACVYQGFQHYQRGSSFKTCKASWLGLNTNIPLEMLINWVNIYRRLSWIFTVQVFCLRFGWNRHSFTMR